MRPRQLGFLGEVSSIPDSMMLRGLNRKKKVPIHFRSIKWRITDKDKQSEDQRQAVNYYTKIKKKQWFGSALFKVHIDAEQLFVG